MGIKNTLLMRLSRPLRLGAAAAALTSFVLTCSAASAGFSSRSNILAGKTSPPPAINPTTHSELADLPLLPSLDAAAPPIGVPTHPHPSPHSHLTTTFPIPPFHRHRSRRTCFAPDAKAMPRCCLEPASPCPSANPVKRDTDVLVHSVNRVHRLEYLPFLSHRQTPQITPPTCLAEGDDPSVPTWSRHIWSGERAGPCGCMPRP